MDPIAYFIGTVSDNLFESWLAYPVAILGYFAFGTTRAIFPKPASQARQSERQTERINTMTVNAAARGEG